MTEIQAELLKWAHNGGYVINNYSGRNMYGTKTIAMVFHSRQEFDEAISEVIENGCEEDRKVAAQLMREIRVDDLGKSKIFY